MLQNLSGDIEVPNRCAVKNEPDSNRVFLAPTGLGTSVTELLALQANSDIHHL